MDRDLALATIDRWNSGRPVTEEKLYKAAFMLSDEADNILGEARYFTILDSYLERGGGMYESEKAFFSKVAGSNYFELQKTASTYAIPEELLLLRSLASNHFVPDLDKIAEMAVEDPSQQVLQQNPQLREQILQDPSMLNQLVEQGQNGETMYRPTPTAPPQMPAGENGNYEQLLWNDQHKDEIEAGQAEQMRQQQMQQMQQNPQPGSKEEITAMYGQMNSQEKVQNAVPYAQPEKMEEIAARIDQVEAQAGSKIMDPKQVQKIYDEMAKLDQKKIDEAIKQISQEAQQAMGQAGQQQLGPFPARLTGGAQGGQPGQQAPQQGGGQQSQGGQMGQGQPQQSKPQMPGAGQAMAKQALMQKLAMLKKKSIPSKTAGILDLWQARNDNHINKKIDIVEKLPAETMTSSEGRHLKDLGKAMETRIGFKTSPKLTAAREVGKTVGKGLVGGLAIYGGKKLYDTYKTAARLPPSALAGTLAGIGGVAGAHAGFSAGDRYDSDISLENRLMRGAAGGLAGALGGGALGYGGGKLLNNRVPALAEPILQGLKEGPVKETFKGMHSIYMNPAVRAGGAGGITDKVIEGYKGLRDNYRIKQLAGDRMQNEVEDPEKAKELGFLMANRGYGDYNTRKLAWSWDGFKEGLVDEGIPLSGAVIGAAVGHKNPLRGAALGYLGGSAASVGRSLATGEPIGPGQALLAASGAGYGLGALGHMGLQKVLPAASRLGKAFNGHGMLQSGVEELMPAVGATLGAATAGGLTHKQNQPAKIAGLGHLYKTVKDVRSLSNNARTTVKQLSPKDYSGWQEKVMNGPLGQRAVDSAELIRHPVKNVARHAGPAVAGVGAGAIGTKGLYDYSQGEEFGKTADFWNWVAKDKSNVLAMAKAQDAAKCFEPNLSIETKE